MRKLKNEEVDKIIKELTDDEYIRLGEYTGTRTKMLVKHNTCKNEYEVTWGNFKKGKRCPKCNGGVGFNNKEIDKRMYELVSSEYIRLGEYINSGTKMLIRHALCGTEYGVVWDSFKQGKRCPKCFNNSKLNNYKVDTKIFQLVGDEYIRLEDYVNSETKMLVRHETCNHQYKVSWNDFRRDRRCPKCFGNKLYGNEEIDIKIKKLSGNEYTRLGEYTGSHTKMLVKHNLCGNEYEVAWNDFSHGYRCPKCKESKGERKISTLLNSLNVKHISQKRFSECKYRQTLPFDFYAYNENSKLLIEFDGIQHFKSIDFFGGAEALRDTQLRDKIKNDFALSKNIPLLRIPYTEQDNIESILTNKLKELDFI
ncbi:hypothetical protein AM4_074 [Lactococcus phage AM4]|uniref:DUF2726 domain-containing protein n=2 Tax=Audreyjarvisvirus AM4 TaxID=2845189 RepID=A0A1W6JKJ3_9CAUD|nr:HNH endonuclease [Lactococcus phage AM4]ARM66733.1 hypothetical protein AM4_074 [Lactococcus phage AM4]ARM66966.1 hypothetical protein AM5_113 [Lactococcus phage AM5]